MLVVCSPGRPAHNPVQHAQFMTSHAIRQRYWLRSALGYPTLSRAQPNAAHSSIAQAMHKAQGMRVVSIITQVCACATVSLSAA